MTSAAVHAGRLSRLLRLTGAGDPPPTISAATPAEHLIWGFLAWECSHKRSARAFERLRSRVVDLNELRVCLTDEIQTLIGDRYPRSRKRASRIRRVLRDLHRREMSTSIDHLLEAHTSDAGAYLMTLDGMLPYAASFACLHGLNHPVIPIDDRLHAALIEEGIADTAATPDEISEAIVERIEPEQCAAVHLRLWSWVDDRDHEAGLDGEE